MVKAIIGRCSPRVENDIGAYVRSVGVKPSGEVDPSRMATVRFPGDIMAQ